jgi:RNA polymerase sigma factor (sigma-70 family)
MTPSRPRLFRRSDEEAWRLVEENRGLAWSIVLQACPLHPHKEDLIQEATLALFEAARRFDTEHESGAKFTTFAGRWISFKVHRLLKHLDQLPDQDSYVSQDLSGETRTERLVDPTAEDLVMRSCHERELYAYLRLLDIEARVIIALRFIAKPRLKYREIGQKFGVSYETIRQKEQAAIAKLRQMMEAKLGRSRQAVPTKGRYTRNNLARSGETDLD